MPFNYDDAMENFKKEPDPALSSFQSSTDISRVVREPQQRYLLSIYTQEKEDPLGMASMLHSVGCLS